MNTEPFLLHPSSRAFLDGDLRGIRERFAFRRDALDYLAMAAIFAGGLLLLVVVARFASWLPAEAAESVAAAFVVAAVLITVGGYFVNTRHSRAAVQLRLLQEGQVVPGTLVSCTARDEIETGFGEVTRSYRVSVEYRFTTPGGEEIVAHDEHNRPDLRRIELSPPETPVRVLYLDEQTYALL